MQTTTSPAAPKAIKPRSRYRSLEFVLGAVLTGVMIVLVLASGWLFPDGGESMDLTARLMAPFTSAAHLFGTDPL
ncbi:peptide ABC transporter permease, partial [Achromobacter xylosoxidans]